MPATIKGLMAAGKDSSFKDSSGKEVKFYRYEIQNKDPEGFTRTLAIGSTKDFTQWVGAECIITLLLRPDAAVPKLFRASIQDVVEE